ncbi:hypothetical protein M422DRAFT_246819 [Sphaerobolus stellatus SS14]|nr:hypothetical protein M422DRAFT_246819 [Sphaerobolus stellatus SS14]
MSNAATPAPAPTTAHPIPIKQRHRSSFSQTLRKRRPSDVDRDRATSSRLAALSLSPPGVTSATSTSAAYAHNHTHHNHTVAKSAPLDEAAASMTMGGKKKGAIFKPTDTPAVSSSIDGSTLPTGAKPASSSYRNINKSNCSRCVSLHSPNPTQYFLSFPPLLVAIAVTRPPQSSPTSPTNSGGSTYLSTSQASYRSL